MTDSEIEIPEWKKKIMNSKYLSSFGSYSNKSLTSNFADIDQRLKDLEHKVNPTAKKIVSNRSQQMLMLHHLGVLDKLSEFKISNKKKAKFLSILLNASPDNIEGDLSNIHNPKSPLNTVANYKVVVDAFKHSGIKKIVDEAQTILEKLPKK
jgi:hypothetical protein